LGRYSELAQLISVKAQFWRVRLVDGRNGGASLRQESRGRDAAPAETDHQDRFVCHHVHS
jgi:hypothetical protein